MASSNEPCAGFFGFFWLFVIILWGARFFILKDTKIDTTPDSIPDCGENSWTAGNAFYTIMALCFGCYAYPRGSLIASPSGRTWRLSPILVLEELGLGIVLFLIARRDSVRLTTFCHAITAYRLSNGFNSNTLQEELDLMITRPPQNDVLEIYRISKELEQQASTNHDTLEPMQIKSIRDEARKRVADRRHEYNIHFFTQILVRLKLSEKGPSYRVFIWFPMILQMIKLVCVMIVSQRMSWVICLIAFTYFFAWLAIELAMLKVSRCGLSNEELKDAAELCHTWKLDLRKWIGEDIFRETGADVNAFAVPSLFLVSAFNVGLTVKFFYDIGLPKFESYWLAMVIVLCLVIASICVFYMFTRPIAMIILLGITRKMWKAVGAEAKWGELWIEAPAEDNASLYTTSAALYSACLFIIALAGIGPWKGAFHCWEMQIPQFYDWLG